MSFGIVRQDLFRTRHLLCDDPFGLVVNGLCGIFRIGFNQSVVVPTRGVIEADILQFIAHTVVCNHGIGLLGGTLQVVECAG